MCVPGDEGVPSGSRRTRRKVDACQLFRNLPARWPQVNPSGASNRDKRRRRSPRHSLIPGLEWWQLIHTNRTLAATTASNTAGLLTSCCGSKNSGVRPLHTRPLGFVYLLTCRTVSFGVPEPKLNRVRPSRLTFFHAGCK